MLFYGLNIFNYVLNSLTVLLLLFAKSNKIKLLLKNNHSQKLSSLNNNMNNITNLRRTSQLILKK